MDDPTRRCENDTGNETRLPRPPIPSGGLIFFLPSRIDTSDQLATFHPRIKRATA
jgi:hypothetical protein